MRTQADNNGRRSENPGHSGSAPAIRNAWYVAAWARDIAPERLFRVRILDEPIVVWRDAKSALVAFADRCLHRLAPLSLGRCEGDRLRCMYHGWLYDRSGNVVEIPGHERVADTLRVKTYPVTEKGGWVWVWMGAGSADQNLIPPIVDLDEFTGADDDYISAHLQLDYSAEGFLVNENLLDLSHLPFLHAESAHMTETWARKRPKYTKRDRSVCTERWIQGEPAGGSTQPGELVDTYSRTEFYVPGILIGKGFGFPVGTADELKGGEPAERRPLWATSHMVTPLGKRSTRYFFSAAFKRGLDGVRDSDSLIAYSQRVFAEDKQMIEAQQQTIDTTPKWHFIPTNNDRGVMLFSQVVARLAREESAQAST